VIPDGAVERVQQWADARVPEHVRDQIRIELDVTDRTITILECRPPWRPDGGDEWTRFPIARLRYTKVRGEWSLYWRDRNLAFHKSDLLHPSPDPRDLLDEIDSDPTAIFWG
jgi:hypothetical protein